MSHAPVVGVLALQGGVAEHLRMLETLGARTVRIRSVSDLVSDTGEPLVDALVLPGGESSTMDRLTRMFGLAAPLKAVLARGLPVLGTCAGLIMLATHVEDPAPGQQTLGALDATVARNAFGAQVDSVEVTLRWRAPAARHPGASGAEPLTGGLATRVTTAGTDARAAGATPVAPAAPAEEVPVAAAKENDVVRAAFIRAPAVTRVGPGTEVLAHYGDRAVALRQGSVLGVSFHPELTGETAVHRLLVRWAQEWRAARAEV